MPVSESFDGQKFTTTIDGKRAATPLLAALVVIEATDVIFAVDSVPAILAVSNEPYSDPGVKCLRDSRAPRDVLPARQRSGPVPLPVARARCDPDLRGHQDGSHRVVPPQHLRLAGHHL